MILISSQLPTPFTHKRAKDGDSVIVSPGKAFLLSSSLLVLLGYLFFWQSPGALFCEPLKRLCGVANAAPKVSGHLSVTATTRSFGPSPASHLLLRGCSPSKPLSDIARFAPRIDPFAIPDLETVHGLMKTYPIEALRNVRGKILMRPAVGMKISAGSSARSVNRYCQPKKIIYLYSGTFRRRSRAIPLVVANISHSATPSATSRASAACSSGRLAS